ncbi:PDZ domain-containing protein [Corallincola spongiicola]|uniref:PDZ domain-containing protein n=1 Tax=Corallincola spongiicola TaxID=2520508 RepID=A0ABY1WNC2_9GAMM|nr:PDZ domain-containing protein [Corallincola spongiicola]
MRPNVLNRSKIIAISLAVLGLLAHASSSADSEVRKQEAAPYAFWGVILQGHYTEKFRQKYDFSFQGVLVNGVSHNSPAELSRIHPCDEITHINEQPFQDTDALIQFVHSLPEDEYFRVRLLRAGRQLTVDSFIRYFDPAKGDARRLEDNFRNSFGQDRCDLSQHRRLPIEFTAP